MILGINSKHDSGAAIVDNGEVIAAADEERFKRKKHYSGFPDASIKYCLDKADVDLSDIEGVAIPWHSLSKVEQACFKHSDIKDISEKI